MGLLWKETKILTCPKVSEKKGFNHLTTVWTLNLAEYQRTGLKALTS